jgi:hypothetical protein
VGNNRGSQTGGPEGQIKNYSHDNLLKETELKAALKRSTRRAKGSLPKKASLLKNGKRRVWGFPLRYFLLFIYLLEFPITIYSL